MEPDSKPSTRKSVTVAQQGDRCERSRHGRMDAPVQGALRQDQPHFHNHHGRRHRSKRRPAPHDRDATHNGPGMEVPAKANVEYVDPYKPLFYGFNTYRRIKPADHALGKAVARWRQEAGGQRLKKLMAACRVAFVWSIRGDRRLFQGGRYFPAGERCHAHSKHILLGIHLIHATALGWSNHLRPLAFGECE